MSFKEDLESSINRNLSALLVSGGLTKVPRKFRWNDEELLITAVRDRGAADPYAGAAFTLEFEKGHGGSKFATGIPGRVRVEQLLDESQRGTFNDTSNQIVQELDPPPDHYVAQFPESLRDHYLGRFRPTAEIQTGRFWMRYMSEGDADRWTSLLAGNLPMLLERARALDPNRSYWGQDFAWR